MVCGDLNLDAVFHWGEPWVHALCSAPPKPPLIKCKDTFWWYFSVLVDPPLEIFLLTPLKV